MWSEYVGKNIQIQCKNGETQSGHCYTIDPISNTIVLLYFSEGSPKIRFVLEHAIEAVSQLDQNCDSEILPEEFITQLDGFLFDKAGFSRSCKPIQLEVRRLKLKKWFHLNRLPVEEEGLILSVANGQAMIEPPYTINSCRSANTIVLDRVMKLVKSCPELQCDTG